MHDLFGQESNKIEYKVKLPTENLKWLKTVVSFSNTSGGKLIIGVEDETLNVIGIDESRSSLENKIVDTIHNYIKPEPIIDIQLNNIQNRDVMVVEIAKGNNTPYYIKSEGMFSGTYVRFGGSDRLATESQIDELRFKSRRENFSETIYVDKDNTKYLVDEIEAQSFVTKINQEIKKTDSVRKEINVSKLYEWEVLKKEFDYGYATNGYMLLNKNELRNSYIKIAVFAGETKSDMLKEKIINGNIIEQFNNTLDYIKEFMIDGYEFKRVRQMKFFVPEEVIREVIANAIIHRNYMEKHPIRIEIYSDRISIVSPGSLYDGLQIEEMLDGTSKLRNENIAEIFYAIGYIERWGSGIIRSNEILNNKNMHPLDINTENIHSVNVTIYYEIKENDRIESQNLEFTEEAIIDYYSRTTGEFTRKDIEIDFDVSIHRARTIIEKMLEEKVIILKGSGRFAFYSINKERLVNGK